ncbi:MAG TPA: acyltransferase [Vicinamibacterales bacterium]|nr:acyltransferase [Vicinamibacterales bacterium]
MSTRRINFGNLDALRGLLAVYVVLGHCRWLLWAGHAAWIAMPHAAWEVIPAYASALLRYGREAVMVFFVLSGFFIHFRAAEPDARDRFHAAPFYWRRLHRLAPPYFFALGITVVFDLIGRRWWPVLYEARTGDQVVDTTFAVGGYPFASIVPAMMLLPSSLGHDFGSNGPLWSIAFEAVYYALYPLWLWIRRRSWIVAFLAIPAMCIALALGPVRMFPVAVLVYYPVWLAGALVAERMITVAVPRRALMIGATMFIAAAVLYVSSDRLFLRVMASAVFGAGLVFAFGGAQSRDRVFMPLFQWLGVRSYTIYIVHFPLLALMSAYVFDKRGGRPLHGWFAAAGAIACVSFGVVCFEWCERHFLHSRFRDASAAP